MYKSILITITFLLSSAAFANQADITKIYNAYVKERTSLIAGSYTRQNIAQKLVPFEKMANESYEKITTLEANEKLELSPEGTQLALDGALLTPLSTLAKSAR
ncbi:MAG: hypothetical protein H7256_00050, partial [Bdellovibrio sp.]|nr:hypothetical protein [Bdellovibrio sp.]